MKKNTIQISLHVLVLTLVGSASFMVAVPHAQALAVSPVLFDVGIEAGARKQGSMTVTNDSNQEETYQVEARNFIPQGEDGAQEYLKEMQLTGLASWIAFDHPSVTLAPGQSSAFPFLVMVPENAPPGGHYASIFFSRAPRATEGGGVGITGKVGVLLLVNVPGEIHEEVRIDSFTLRGAQVRSHLPVRFDVRLQNNGSTHVRPQGWFTVRNLFGREVYRAAVNSKNAAVLPQSVRRLESAWPEGDEPEASRGFLQGVQQEWEHFAIGRYRASLEIAYSDKAQTLHSSEVAFWVIPWRLMVIAMTAIALLIVLLRAYHHMLLRAAIRKVKKKESVHESHV